MGELEMRMLIRAANPGRDRLMLEVAYFGGLRVSELVSLTWAQVIRRDDGQAQLSIIGKGDKEREVLIPAVIAGPLWASRGEAPASAPVFPSVRNPGHALTERAVNYIIKDAAERAGINPAASVHWLRHALGLAPVCAAVPARRRRAHRSRPGRPDRGLPRDGGHRRR
jgi:integrase/recombinase XerD